jgi:hypothetical protein
VGSVPLNRCVEVADSVESPASKAHKGNPAVIQPALGHVEIARCLLHRQEGAARLATVCWRLDIGSCWSVVHSGPLIPRTLFTQQYGVLLCEFVQVPSFWGADKLGQFLLVFFVRFVLVLQAERFIDDLTVPLLAWPGVHRSQPAIQLWWASVFTSPLGLGFLPRKGHASVEKRCRVAQLHSPARASKSLRPRAFASSSRASPHGPTC